LTIIDSEDARLLAKVTHCRIACVLFMNQEKVGIRADDIRTLSSLVGYNVFFFLMRSVGGETLKRLTQFYTVKEDRTTLPQKPAGWLG
jgi:hypothetical protein